MAYVPVPKDLSKVKTKVALNLTKRQLICFSLAGLCGLPVYFLTKSTIGTDIAATLMVILMLPFFFLAMYEKDGFPAEKIILHMINQKFRRPGVRVYRSENFYDRLIAQSKIEKEGARLEKKAKEAREARKLFHFSKKADHKK
ncbi:MAG: PrgI family protein [Lachnospiraceae bacterium]|nr:PrgI family protein [Lachnospiraceae bacterium]